MGNWQLFVKVNIQAIFGRFCQIWAEKVDFGAKHLLVAQKVPLAMIQRKKKSNYNLVTYHV